MRRMALESFGTRGTRSRARVREHTFSKNPLAKTCNLITPSHFLHGDAIRQQLCYRSSSEVRLILVAEHYRHLLDFCLDSRAATIIYSDASKRVVSHSQLFRIRDRRKHGRRFLTTL